MKRRPVTILFAKQQGRRPQDVSSRNVVCAKGLGWNSAEEARCSLSLSLSHALLFKTSAARGNQPQSSSSTSLWNLLERSSNKDPMSHGQQTSSAGMEAKSGALHLDAGGCRTTSKGCRRTRPRRLFRLGGGGRDESTSHPMTRTNCMPLTPSDFCLQKLALILTVS